MAYTTWYVTSSRKDMENQASSRVRAQWDRQMETSLRQQIVFKLAAKNHLCMHTDSILV